MEPVGWDFATPKPGSLRHVCEHPRQLGKAHLLFAVPADRVVLLRVACGARRQQSVDVARAILAEDFISFRADHHITRLARREGVEWRRWPPLDAQTAISALPTNAFEVPQNGVVTFTDHEWRSLLGLRGAEQKTAASDGNRACTPMPA